MINSNNQFIYLEIKMDSIVHFEIPAKDSKRSKDFYSKVFGWEFIDMPEMNYTIVRTTATDDKGMTLEKGAINGGMMTEKDNGGTNPVLVIMVKSIDEHLKKIEAAGGKVIQPKTSVGDMGYYARFKDTEDVVMGIFETK